MCIRDRCQRVVIIAGGQIHYDGSLDGVIDQFSSDKIVTLQVSESEDLESLSQLPNVVEVQPPKVKFRVGRDDVARVLGEILSSRSVEDIVVEDPPLEEVIASVFTLAAQEQAGNSTEQTGAVVQGD